MRGRTLILHVPPLLAVALFEQMFLDRTTVPIGIDGKERGMFRLIGAAYPDCLYDDGLVDIHLEAVHVPGGRKP